MTKKKRRHQKRRRGGKKRIKKTAEGNREELEKIKARRSELQR